MSHLKILGARRVTSKFHTGEPQILAATVQNLVARLTRRPGFVNPWVLDNGFTANKTCIVSYCCYLLTPIKQRANHQLRSPGCELRMKYVCQLVTLKSNFFIT